MFSKPIHISWYKQVQLVASSLAHKPTANQVYVKIPVSTQPVSITHDTNK